MPAGRPPGRDPVPAEKAEAVIEWLTEGGSLYEFCRQPGNPRIRTVYAWCEKDPDFDARFARARKLGAASMMEKAQAIADDPTGDWVVDDRGAKQLDREHIQRSKLRVDTMLRRAACFSPEQFGTRVQMTGITGAPPIKIESTGPSIPSDPNAAIAWLKALVPTAPEEESEGDREDGS